ncbi:MAG TPA: cysteine--tRNA ligase [Beijerinckiaceae bacterium]|jgi:cysteinyl-tRNA synthetase
MPTLRLYNTLTRTKDEFRPIDPSHVRMYVCGPTVYDFAHIGNARPVIVFDLLFRLLRHLYGEGAVTYVRNVTDVDDKINARAAERGVPIREITEATLKQFHADIAALGALPPTVEPRATEHIAEMRQLIERLVANGHAYVAEDHVLFDVPSMPDYGRLSKRPLDEMEAGARVDVAPYKRSPLDFVLWKPSKPGEPSWPSPAGIAAPGRPGWHIECSAMSWKHLGEMFDIHGGGVDLVFPHHENEVAQTRCSFGTSVMANVWMHNGFLQVESEKMSKSLGNFVTINELLESDRFGGRSWSGEVLRLAMLRTHYRQPIDWTVRGLEEAERTLASWTAFPEFMNGTGDELSPEVLEALLDDLNTPKAIAELHALDRKGDRSALASSLRALGFRTGLHQDDSVAPEVASKVEDLISIRRSARAQKKWAESDRIRDELAAMGIVLKDNKDGTTTWEVAR